MDIYTHVTKKTKNEVADKFASYIGFYNIGITVGIKTKKEALQKVEKPYLMLLRAII